jgi:hypothetical protein
MTGNKEELAERLHQYFEIISGFRVRRLLGLLPWFLPACAYMILHAWYLQPRLSEGWRELSAAVAMSFMLITIIWCWYRTHRWHVKTAKQLELLCPSCDHPLTGKGGQESLRLGKCSFCGSKLDGESSSSSRPHDGE